MSDMTDLFKALKKVRQESNAENRELAPELLTQAGVKFESKNFGAHLIVDAGSVKIDFWPGPDKWIVRGNPSRKYDIMKLIEFVKGNQQ